MQIAKVNAEIMQKYGKYLFNETRDSVNSFEQAAQILVRDFYRSFCNEAQEPEFALVRIFRSMKYDELSPKLQQISQTQQAQLALMATTGLEAVWNSRETSKNRQLIPINHKMSPMFQGVFKELGFQIDDFNEDAAAKGQAVHNMKMLRYFHVPDASQSAAITDQNNFVKPYGIQSVIAFGTQFLSHQAYVMIAFSRQPISPKQAESIAELAPHISTLLAIFDGRKALWAV